MNTVTNNVISAEALSIAKTGNSMIAAFGHETLEKFEGRVDLCLNDGRVAAPARGVFSALMHIMRGGEVIGDGYIAKNREVIYGVPMRGNMGYFLGSKLQMLKGATVRVLGAQLNPFGIYEVTYDGFVFVASHIEYISATKDEGDYAKKSRSVTRLFQGAQVLFQAMKGDYAVKLYWSSKEDDRDYTPLAEYVVKMYSLFATGDTDGVADMHSTGMTKSKVWSSTGAAMRMVARGEVLEAVALKLYSAVVVDTPALVKVDEELVGRQVMVMRGSMPIKPFTFNEGYAEQAHGIAVTGCTVQFVE